MGHRLAVRERPAGKDRKIGFVLRVAHRSVSDQFDVRFPDVNLLADRVRTWRFSRPLKSAIIVNERVQLGLARMFQT